MCETLNRDHGTKLYEQGWISTLAVKHINIIDLDGLVTNRTTAQLAQLDNVTKREVIREVIKEQAMD